MVNEILGAVLIFGITLILAFSIDYKKSIKYWYILLLFLMIGFVDCLFHTLTMTFPDIQLIKTYIWHNNLIFNWSTKLYSIAFSLILLIPLKKILTPDDLGLRFKQNEKSIIFSLLLVIFFFIVASTLGILSAKVKFDSNPLFYTAIMPGLAEELMYRGLLLALLNKIFERKFKVLGTNFGWGAILTSIAFGLIHGFHLGDNFQIHLDFMTIFLTGCYGFLFALMRERSGSLIFPILGHSTADFFNFFFRMI